MFYSNTLNLIQVGGGTQVKQGDLGSKFSYKLANEKDQELDDFDKEVAHINLVLNDKIVFTTTATVDNSTVTFNIDKAIPVGLYFLEIKIRDYIFPSDKQTIIFVQSGAVAYDLKDLVPNYDVNMTLKGILSDLSQKGAEITAARGAHPNLRSRLDEADNKQKQTTAQLAQTNAQLAEKANKDELTNVMTPKGNIAYASLPMTGNSVGWYYYCPDGDGTHGAGNYVWNGTSWFFGGTGDEGYNLLKSDLDTSNKKIINSIGSIVDYNESETGGFNSSTGEFNTDSNYVHSKNFIPISKNYLALVDSSSLSSITPRFTVFYNSRYEFQTYSSNKIDSEMVSQYPYAKLVYSSSLKDSSIVVTDDDNDGKLTNDVDNLSFNVSKIKNDYYPAQDYTFEDGGFSIDARMFNKDTKYSHSKYFIEIKNGVSASIKPRFTIYYDENRNFVEYEENDFTYANTKSYPYCKFVIFTTDIERFTKYLKADDTKGMITKSIESLIDSIHGIVDTTKISREIFNTTFSVGGFDTINNKFNTDSTYVHTDDFVPVKNGEVTVSANPRMVVYYDENYNFLSYSDNRINYDMVDIASYVKFVIRKDLNNPKIITADGSTPDDIKISKYANRFNKYRYLAFTFGNGGNFGLYILGSNDLKRFNLLNEEFPFIPSRNYGVRDPAVIFLDGWYYIVYTPLSFLEHCNYIGLVRTKDFVIWEELPNLTINPSNGDVISDAWAPVWYKEDDDVYIIVSCATSYEANDFVHRIVKFDLDTLTIGNAFTTNITFIDCHIYKENDVYYALGSSGTLWKSDTLLSDSWERITNNSLTRVHYEGQFAIRLDNGNLRVFGQNVLNTADNVLNAHIFYQDGGASFESEFSPRKEVSYDKDTISYASKTWGTDIGYFWHLTIFDKNCYLDNNNNYSK